MNPSPQQPAAEKVYFLKVILTNPFFVGGQAVPFEPIAGNQGIIALDPQKDARLIESLTEAAKNQIGGIGLITQALYEEKKTQPDSTTYGERRRETLRVVPPGPNPFNIPTTVQKAVGRVEPAAAPVAAPAAAPVASPVPPTVPAPPAEPPVFRPTTRRISRQPSSEQRPIPAG